MTRIHAGFLALSIVMVLVMLALTACEGTGPRNCPPPIGCSK